MKTRAREEQLMVGYLLGTASELEQSQIETRYFREQQLFEQMLALEEELICDYLNETLTATERQQFERHFLNTPRRRRKFLATRKLMSFIADQRHVRPSTPPRSNWRTWFSHYTNWLNNLFAPKFSFVWTLALVMILSFGVLLLSVRVAALRNQVEKTESQQLAVRKLPQKPKGKPERTAGATTERLYNDQAHVADQLQASLDPAFLGNSGETSAEKIISVNLRPSRLRGTAETQTVTLQPEVTLLRVRLTSGQTNQSGRTSQLIPQSIDSYVATMKTWEGREILRVPVDKQIVQSGQSFSLEVPAEKLQRGHYVLTLKGHSTTQETPHAEEFFLQILRD